MARDVPPPIQRLSGARRAILYFLKEHQPQRAEDMSNALQVTVSGIRQQLATLTAEGLITFDTQRGQPGRPKYLYRLTEQGDALFPRNYAAFATDFINYLDDEDPAMLQRLFERRTQRRSERMALRLRDRDLRERVREIAAMLDEEGYMAHAEDAGNGEWLIVEQNCPLLELAQVNTHINTADLDVLRNLLPDCTVERTEDILNGDIRSTYRVTPNER